MEELHGAFENENIEQNADADYYYSRYRAALHARRKSEKPARMAIGRLCALVIVQNALALLLQAGVLSALRLFSGSMSRGRYQQIVDTLFSYETVAGLVFVSALYTLCLFIPFAVYAAARRRHAPSVGIFAHPAVSFNKISPLPLATAFFISLGAGVLAKWGNTIIMSILGELGITPPSPDLSWPASPVAQLLLVVSIAALPALIEEFGYRGVALGELVGFNPRAAIVFSSLLFALMHSNIAQFFYAFVIGVFIAYFVLRFRSVWVGVAVHFGFNLYGAVLPLLLGYNSPDANQLKLGLMIILLDTGIIFVGSLFLALMLVKYRGGLPQPQSDAVSSRRFAALVLTSPVFYVLLAVTAVITVMNTAV